MLKTQPTPKRYNKSALVSYSDTINKSSQYNTPSLPSNNKIISSTSTKSKIHHKNENHQTLHLIPPNENLPKTLLYSTSYVSCASKKIVLKHSFFFHSFCLGAFAGFHLTLSFHFSIMDSPPHITRNLFLPRPNACQITCFLPEPSFWIFSPSQDFYLPFLFYFWLFFF